MIIEGTPLCADLDLSVDGPCLCLRDGYGDFINIDCEQAEQLAVALAEYAMTGELPE